MKKVTFESLKFEEIWVDTQEDNFYKWAWKVLDENGKTSYCNDEEKCEVFLIKYALEAIYADYCDVAFEEGGTFDLLEVEDEFTKEIVYKLYGEYVEGTPSENGYYIDEDDFEIDMVMDIINYIRGSFANLLLSQIPTIEMYKLLKDTLLPRLDCVEDMEEYELIYIEPIHTEQSYSWISDGMMKFR